MSLKDDRFITDEIITQFEHTTEMRRKDAYIERVVAQSEQVARAGKILSVLAFFVGLVVGSIL